MLDFYTVQYNRCRPWDVIEVSPNQKITPGSAATISKALACSQLEIPVGDWIDDTLKKSVVTPSCKKILKKNIEDEIKHDAALNNLRKVFEVKSEDDVIVAQFLERAKELAERVSPIVMAGTLESSLFFVILPMFRFLGGSGFRTVANDISNDENIHVAVNVNLAKDLGYRRNAIVNSFRKEIVNWIVSDLDKENENKYLSADFWRKSSDNLYHSGKAPQLRETRRAVMPSFFEKDNRDLPSYG